jgi:hypothetical protein
MSQFRVCKLKITNANLQTLRLAVEELAKALGGEVVSSVRDYYGHVQEVPVGLRTQELRRGIGFRIENGQIVSVGDSWGVSSEYRDMEKALAKYYTAAALSQKLKAQGYSVKINTSQEGKVVVYAYS